MIKSAIDSVKTLFGFKGRRRTEFDDAMLSILKAAADSRLCLTGPESAKLDAAKRGELAHAWSESAIKVNRLDDALRDGCLGLARRFAEMDAGVARVGETDLERVEAVFARTCQCLKEARV